MQLEANDISMIKSSYDSHPNNIISICKPLPSELIISLSSSSSNNNNNTHSSSILCKSSLLLAIIEIITNPKAYNPRYLPSHKIFWRQSIQSDLLKPILSQFTLSSLRINYTLLHRNKEKLNDMITVIKANEAVINSCRYNIFMIIIAIIRKLKPKNSFEAFENILIEAKHKMKLKPISLYPIRNFQKKIVTKKIAKPIRKVLNEEENEAIMIMLSQSYWEKKVYPLHIKDKEFDSYKDIDDIISCFQLLFPKEEKKTIINILARNSMNIMKTYNIMNSNCSDSTKDKEDIDKGFTHANDYIIKNMKGTDIYQKLLEEKGIDSINERKRYLNIKPVNEEYINFSLL